MIFTDTFFIKYPFIKVKLFLKLLPKKMLAIPFGKYFKALNHI